MTPNRWALFKQTPFYCNCPGTLGDVNPLRNKGLRFPPRRKLASKRVQNTTLGAIAQKNTSIYQWVGVPGQLLIFIISRLELEAKPEFRKVPSLAGRSVEGPRPA